MKIEVAFKLEELTNSDLHSKTVVAIDVLRATSTMISALYQRAAAIIPTEEIERAINLKKSDNLALLCGERNGLKIEGFDKGNSPLEFEGCAGRTLIFCSTNGTKNIELGKRSRNLYLGALVNGKYLATRLWQQHQQEELLLSCSGKLGRPCLEDTLCAGALVAELEKLGEQQLEDSAIMARDLYLYHRGRILERVRESEHGLYLRTLGFDQDIDWCCQESILNLAPRFDKNSSCLIAE